MASLLQNISADLALDKESIVDRESREPELGSPAKLMQRFPCAAANRSVVEQSRRVIESILKGDDPRALVIVGPCSIHDYDSALDYAERLQQLSSKVSDKLFLVMRCYFEKPRTALGWKGLINDPHLDGSDDIAAGVELVRRILLDITGMGVPVATEALDPNLSNYYQDLISWTAIGARTAESQLHRQLASGLASPVGIKNATDGRIDTTVNALVAARARHRYVGIDREGSMKIVQTEGNDASHIILRGGHSGPNYDAKAIQHCKQLLVQAGLSSRIVVDCSHANSGKDASQQGIVMEDVISQIAAGERAIAGIMLESHVNPGRQVLQPERIALNYGVSITDECLGWDATAELLLRLGGKLQ